MIRTINRRALIGSALATAALPGLARAQGNDPASQEPTDMRINVMFGGMTMAVMLYDNPSARDLYSMLPLDETIQDYSNNEKIVYLPRRLTQDGSGRFGNERPGDLAYYAPWGNLVFYYAGYRYSNGLIRLGRMEEGFEPLLTRGEFPVRIEPVAS
ncbi:MFS transporter [Paracoccus denitrificans]|uniref:cyclophilin-like fold protein n=1 Tax=Paracoccus denitrificans TaxID=266 RepID=UPI001E54834B|nr:cyclophilin-like fold protein [Paracoccus denitrificans]UFS65318.1 MFS transporter [Paracoccus denitrificans]